MLRHQMCRRLVDHIHLLLRDSSAMGPIQTMLRLQTPLKWKYIPSKVQYWLQITTYSSIIGNKILR